MVRGTQSGCSKSRVYQASIFAFLVMVPHGMSPEERLSSYGSPDYALFSKRPLPGVIRGDSHQGPLGESVLSAQGIRDKEWRLSKTRRGR